MIQSKEIICSLLDWKKAESLQITDKLRNPAGELRQISLLLSFLKHSSLQMYTYNKDKTKRQIFTVSACQRFVDSNKKIILARDSINTLLYNGWRVLKIEEGEPTMMIYIQVDGGYYILGGSNAVLVGDNFDPITRKYKESFPEGTRTFKD